MKASRLASVFLVVMLAIGLVLYLAIAVPFKGPKRTMSGTVIGGDHGLFFSSDDGEQGGYLCSSKRQSRFWLSYDLMGRQLHIRFIARAYYKPELQMLSPPCDFDIVRMLEIGGSVPQ